MRNRRDNDLLLSIKVIAYSLFERRQGVLWVFFAVHKSTPGDFGCLLTLWVILTSTRHLLSIPRLASVEKAIHKVASADERGGPADQEASELSEDTLKATDVTKEVEGVVNWPRDDSVVHVPENCEASNFVVTIKIVRITKTQTTQGELIERPWRHDTNVEVSNFIGDSHRVEGGLHPIGLRLVNVLVPNHSFIDDRVIIEDRIVKPLLIRHDHQLGVAQVILKVLQGLWSAHGTWSPFTSCEVNVESDTINLVCAADRQVLPLVNAVQNLILEELLGKINVVDRDGVKRVVVSLRAGMVAQRNRVDNLQVFSGFEENLEAHEVWIWEPHVQWVIHNPKGDFEPFVVEAHFVFVGEVVLGSFNCNRGLLTEDQFVKLLNSVHKHQEKQ